MLLNKPLKTLISWGSSFFALISLKIWSITYILKRKAQWRAIPGFLLTSTFPVIISLSGIVRIVELGPFQQYQASAALISVITYLHSQSAVQLVPASTGVKPPYLFYIYLNQSQSLAGSMKLKVPVLLQRKQNKRPLNKRI